MHCVLVVRALIVDTQCNNGASRIRCKDREGGEGREDWREGRSALKLGLKFDQDEFTYRTKIKEVYDRF